MGWKRRTDGLKMVLMPAKIIDGKKMADAILEKARGAVASLSPKPCLALVIVGENPASLVYTKKKGEDCKKVGIVSRSIRLSASSKEKEVIEEVRKLNGDETVDAIIVQLPLPDSIDEEKILAEISPEKDADGFHPENFGKAALGIGRLLPCTPKGVIRMLKESGVQLSGKHAAVIGRSRIVGKPLALLLLNENCTVTVCHSRTRNIGEITRQADIVCVAVGKPKTLTAGMVKEGAVVIDVGMNRVDRKGQLVHKSYDASDDCVNREGEKLVGDVDFGPVASKASLITPVPGGVGPMTRAMLIENTLECYRQRRKK